MKTHKHSMLHPGKTNFLDGKVKLLEGKMEHLKMERSKMLKMEKSDALESVKKFSAHKHK